ncbi:MAG TPA: TRAP transporter small permease subunit, partial [Castellaniella sp.]|nr:TRAP transporter small permease subunit [Castellaniella sp.]
SGALLLVMTFVLFLNIVARNFLGYSYIGAEAVGTYLMVWLTFIGAAFIVPNHGHVSVDLLLRAAGPRLMRAVVMITAVVGMGTSVYMAFLGIQLTEFIFTTGQVETTLNISTGYLYLPVGIGMILMFINYAELLAAMLRKDDSRLPVVEVEI